MKDFRQEAIARFTGTTYPVAAERVVKISLLRPADQKTISALAPLAELAAKSFANIAPGNTNAEAVFQAAWGSLSVALMEYRQGDYAKAEQWCRRCLAYPGDNPPRVATARVILAMSCHQLGQNQEAISSIGARPGKHRSANSRWSGSRQRRAWFLVRLGLRPHSVT